MLSLCLGLQYGRRRHVVKTQANLFLTSPAARPTRCRNQEWHLKMRSDRARKMLVAAKPFKAVTFSALSISALGYRRAIREHFINDVRIGRGDGVAKKKINVHYIQILAKRFVRGCEKFVPALAYLFCMPLPGSCLARFAYLLADLCTYWPFIYTTMRKISEN